MAQEITRLRQHGDNEDVEVSSNHHQDSNSDSDELSQTNTQSVLARMMRMRDYDDRRTAFTTEGVKLYGPVFHRIKSLCLKVIHLEINLNDHPEQIVTSFMTYLSQIIKECREDVIQRKAVKLIFSRLPSTCNILK